MLAAAALGVVAGSVVSLLFAPDKGEDTRRKIAKKSSKMLHSLKEFDKQKLAKIKGKLEDKLKKINSRMEEFSKETPNGA